MNFDKIEFNSIPGFSKLFLDYISNNAFLGLRFPNNNKLFTDSSFLSKRNINSNIRNQLINSIKKSMNCVNLSISQQNNLDLLISNNTFVVLTGQQVGFLGGPIYTFLKIFTAIQYANKLKLIHKYRCFIPLFWLEDNDHDNFEASHIYTYNNQYEITESICENSINKNDKRTVSSRCFNSDIIDIIKNIELMLPDNKYKNDIIVFLNSIYKNNIYWNDAFIMFLQKIFADFGLLIIKSSELREAGLFADFGLKELKNINTVNSLIQKTNQKLTDNNYHIQAKSSPINLFFHKDNIRHKLKQSIELFIDNDNNQYTKNELISILEKDKTAFSPNVILRPVFQDSLIPTVAYIAGPSEVGYLSQLKEIYDFFEIDMPAILSRHSATIIDNRINRFMEKNLIPIEYYLCNSNLNQKTKNLLIENSSIHDKFTNFHTFINNLYLDLSTEIIKIDKSLEKSAFAACTTSINELDKLYKKVSSSINKQNTDFINKQNEATNLLYPLNTLQERIFSPINFLTSFGFDEFINCLFELTQKDNKYHYIIKP